MITIRRIEPVQGMRVVFNDPLIIKEKRDGNYYKAEMEIIGMLVLEHTITELRDSIVEFLEVDYIAYALALDNTLTEKAQEIKQWFLANTHVEEVKS